MFLQYNEMIELVYKQAAKGFIFLENAAFYLINYKIHMEEMLEFNLFY